MADQRRMDVQQLAGLTDQELIVHAIREATMMVARDIEPFQETNDLAPSRSFGSKMSWPHVIDWSVATACGHYRYQRIDRRRLLAPTHSARGARVPYGSPSDCQPFSALAAGRI